MHSISQVVMLALSNDFLLKGTNLPAILPPALAPLYQEWEVWSWAGSRKWPPTSSSGRTATRTSQIPASGLIRVVSGARGSQVRTGDGEKTQRQVSWGSENQSLPLPKLFLMHAERQRFCRCVEENWICFGSACLIQVFSILVVLLSHEVLFE